MAKTPANNSNENTDMTRSRVQIDTSAFVNESQKDQQLVLAVNGNIEKEIDHFINDNFNYVDCIIPEESSHSLSRINLPHAQS